ncbi:MAG TPA: hypothetical protein VM052_07635, partial [Candidatus Limnocylindrales bacterium]|nr:hypothetical protein [Candidatus Limnocylindrales bacterium]
RAVAPKIESFIGDATVAARAYLGLGVADVASALRSGKSLGEVANGVTGKSRDGLIAAITASVNTKLDAATGSGRLTADQATALKATAGKAVATIVDKKAPAREKKP